jgi:hypothetical protein
MEKEGKKEEYGRKSRRNFWKTETDIAVRLLDDQCGDTQGR